jgi:putative FmdB family regulatory protein
MPPLYDYECRYCKTVILDKFESINADLIQDCPHCGQKQQLYRILVSPPQIAFAGGGWYKDSYERK